MPRYRCYLPYRFRFTPALLVLLSAFALGSSAFATIIVSDTFTGADNTALLGRLPSPTDVPGTFYLGNGNLSAIGGFTGGTPYEADIQSNMARIGADAGVAVNLGLGSANIFQLSISFNISNDTETQADNPRRGAGLGFFSSVAVGSGGAFHCYNNFTGLAVDTTGSVRLIIAGTDSGIFTTVAGFNPALTHTLTYQVDTTVGAGSIWNIQLDGTSVSLTAPVNTFTVARATLAGFYNSAGGFTPLGNFDDFTVAVAPEPSTLGAIAFVVILICLTDLRRRRVRQI